MKSERQNNSFSAETVFTEEIINSFVKEGAIRCSLHPSKIIRLVGESLSRQVRFNGMCRIGWTVLAHSFLVSLLTHDKMMVDGCHDDGEVRAWMLAGLLHDVGEAIVGDVIFPLKNDFFKKTYDESYLPLESAFREWFATEALGIADFNEIWSSSEKTVMEADRMAGSIELFALSSIGDFQFGEFLEKAGITMRIGDFARECTPQAFEANIRELTAGNSIQKP